MRPKTGFPGAARVGIVLLWLLPTAEEDESAAFAALDPSEVEQFEAITGLALHDLVERIQGLAVGYREDPRAMRAEVVRLMGGNEIAAEYILKLLAAVWDDREPAEEAPREEPGDVVAFERAEEEDAGDEEEEEEEEERDGDDEGEEP